MRLNSLNFQSDQILPVPMFLIRILRLKPVIQLEHFFVTFLVTRKA